MIFNEIYNLEENKKTHPSFERPIPGNEYYLSSEEYNKLVRVLKNFARDYEAKLSTIGSGGTVQTIPSTSSEAPSDSTVFTSLKTIDEINKLRGDKKYISKINDDTALGEINFTKGIKFGDALDIDRSYIHGDGHAMLRSLKVLESLEVPELIHNRVEIYTGDR